MHPTSKAAKERIETTKRRRRFHIHADDLGELVLNAVEQLQGGLTFRELCSRHRGPSCIEKTNVRNRRHPSNRFLQFIRKSGAPVLLSGRPWSGAQLLRAMRQGCHVSAKAYSKFLRTEMATMVKQGFWIVLPESIARLLPGLRVAPIGVVPQRDRRPRTIVDYSFWGQNGETLNLNPNSMQYGKAFDRILYQLETADTRHGPLFLLKVDISDGYYRIPLQLDAIPRLGALLPKQQDEEQLVAFPTVLPMGWQNSAPIFCAATETIADLTNERLQTTLPPDDVPHRLESYADTKPMRIKRPRSERKLETATAPPPPSVRSRGRMVPPRAYTDVFVDDLVQICQGSRRRRKLVRRILLESVDAIFRPLAPGDRPTRKEPTSVKKLGKGDAYFATRKIILGWLIDTLARTIELPPHRVDRLRELLASISPSQTTVSRRKWQQVLGELRSMALALPASRGMFSQLQAVLTPTPTPKPHDRLPLSQASHDALNDFRWLAESVAARPTRWGEIVPQAEPEYLGAQDASAKGMGGVWFPREPTTAPPLLWRHRFAADTTSAVVSFANPKGTLTNSDLELVAHVAAHDVLVTEADMREKTAYALSDNTPTLSWARRGSVSTDSSAAYLLRLHALHQRYHRYTSQHSHIPGELNVMADILSQIALEGLPAEIIDELSDDFRIIEETIERGITQERSRSRDRTFEIWCDFRQQFGKAPYLMDSTNPVAWLLLYGERVRSGRLAKNGHPVRARTVEEELLAVATAHTLLGYADPRLNEAGKVDYRIAQLLKAYGKEDPPPKRVKPVPVPVLHRAYEIAQEQGDARSLAAGDLMWIGFFFLGRPGEYTAASEESTPFRACDVTLFHDDIPCAFDSATDEAIAAANFVTNEFTEQKNSVRGEVVGHGGTSSVTANPVEATKRRFQHLRQHGATADTNLCAYFHKGKWKEVKSADITKLLRQAASELPQYNLLPSDVSTRSLRAAGAMALLCKHVDTDIIRLMGRWRSDEMLRYLHLQAQPLMEGFAEKMLQGGDYSLLPSTPDQSLPTVPVV